MTKFLIRVARLLSTGLVVLGIITFLAASGMYAYTAYERYRFEQELPQLLERVEASANEPIAETPVEASSAPIQAQLEPWRLASKTEPTPAPAPVPRMPRARRVMIPKIGVDSPVVEARIEDGEWQVPKFVAGHLERTANPGEKSNVALSGHVESFSSGNVFARLEELQLGDTVTLVAGEREFIYEVAGTKVVAITDVSVVAPTPREVLSLITCTGAWNPLTRDYPKRFVVTGELKEVKPIAPE